MARKNLRRSWRSWKRSVFGRRTIKAQGINSCLMCLMIDDVVLDSITFLMKRFRSRFSLGQQKIVSFKKKKMQETCYYWLDQTGGPETISKILDRKYWSVSSSHQFTPGTNSVKLIVSPGAKLYPIYQDLQPYQSARF